MTEAAEPRPTRLIGYLRVSTEHQSGSGLGLAAQRAAITNACKQNGWELVDVITDVGTGANLERPGIQQAFQRIADKEADGLIVSKADRLSRSLMDLAGTIKTFQRKRWTLVMLDLAIDLSTPAGKAMAGMLGVFAEFERETIGTRIKEALQAAAARGQVLGRPIKPGLREAIMKERLAHPNLTLQDLAEQLAVKGFTTKSGRAYSRSYLNTVMGEEAMRRQGPRFTAKQRRQQKIWAQKRRIQHLYKVGIIKPKGSPKV